MISMFQTISTHQVTPRGNLFQLLYDIGTMAWLGTKEVAFIIVDSPDYPPLPQDWESRVRKRLFYDDEHLSDLRSYIRTVSYGKAKLTGDVYGPFSISLPRGNDGRIGYGLIIDAGIQAAQGCIEGYSYACVIATDNKLTD
jgi:hypothetical protein